MTADGVGERLVTVLLTLAVPEMADPEDAAALVADAAATTALEVRHAVGVESHLPAPGATVVRPGRRQPWQVHDVPGQVPQPQRVSGDRHEAARLTTRRAHHVAPVVPVHICTAIRCSVEWTGAPLITSLRVIRGATCARRPAGQSVS